MRSWAQVYQWSPKKLNDQVLGLYKVWWAKICCHLFFFLRCSVLILRLQTLDPSMLTLLSMFWYTLSPYLQARLPQPIIFFYPDVLEIKISSSTTLDPFHLVTELPSCINTTSKKTGFWCMPKLWIIKTSEKVTQSSEFAELFFTGSWCARILFWGVVICDKRVGALKIMLRCKMCHWLCWW